MGLEVCTQWRGICLTCARSWVQSPILPFKAKWPNKRRRGVRVGEEGREGFHGVRGSVGTGVLGTEMGVGWYNEQSRAVNGSRPP